MKVGWIGANIVEKDIHEGKDFCYLHSSDPEPKIHVKAVIYEVHEWPKLYIKNIVTHMIQKMATPFPFTALVFRHNLRLRIGKLFSSFGFTHCVEEEEQIVEYLYGFTRWMTEKERYERKPERIGFTIVFHARKVHWDGDKLERKKYVKGFEPTQDCSVCLEELKTGEDIIKFKCQHAFHPNCVLTWLCDKTTCPTCRCRL